MTNEYAKQMAPVSSSVITRQMAPVSSSVADLVKQAANKQIQMPTVTRQSAPIQYDVNSVLKNAYNTAVAAGGKNIPKPPVVSGTITDINKANSLVESYKNTIPPIKPTVASGLQDTISNSTMKQMPTVSRGIQEVAKQMPIVSSGVANAVTQVAMKQMPTVSRGVASAVTQLATKPMDTAKLAPNPNNEASQLKNSLFGAGSLSSNDVHIDSIRSNLNSVLNGNKTGVVGQANLVNAQRLLGSAATEKNAVTRQAYITQAKNEMMTANKLVQSVSTKKIVL